MIDPVAGGCHCGFFRYRLSGTVPIHEWTARYCGCGFCTKHGALYASHPGAVLELMPRDRGLAGKYRFATASADFCFCRNCGVLTHLVCEIDGNTYGLVNVNTLDERIAGFASAPVMSYEGEDRSARMGRRKENWIPEVIVRE